MPHESTGSLGTDYLGAERDVVPEEGTVPLGQDAPPKLSEQLRGLSHPLSVDGVSLSTSQRQR